MSQSATIRLGVIGCGHWGPNHVRVFASLPDAAAPVAAEVDEARRAAVAPLFRDTQFVADYRELLRRPDLDAVVVATPTATHAAIAREALEAGKDVLCEKPLALDSAEAMALTELAERRGRVLMVGHIFLYNNGVRELRRIVQAGELGRTRYLQATRTNLGPIRSDVNVVYDLASHDVSIFNYLLGDPPTHVRAAGMSFLQHGVEDVAFVTLYYPNQVLAHLQASWLHPKKVRELTIVGDRKMATWNDLSTTGPIALFAKHVLTPGDFTDFGQFHLLVKDGDINIPYVPLREPLRVQAEAFLHAVRTRERPLADGRFAAQVAAALAAANRSMRSDGETTPVEI